MAENGDENALKTGMQLLGDIDYVPPQQILVPVKDFISFLAQRKRSNKCPVCPHSGGWIVHAHEINDIDVAKVYMMPSPFGEQYLSVIVMECPKCGFIQNTNAVTVARAMESGNNE